VGQATCDLASRTRIVWRLARGPASDARYCCANHRKEAHLHQGSHGKFITPRALGPTPAAATAEPLALSGDAAAQVALPGVPMVRTYVAALYIDRHGPYPTLFGFEMCWPEERDAMTYEGPWPVVANPPRAPRSRARALSHGRAQGLHAVEQVRRWGGRS
jgi:hypothetical protein